MSLARRGLLECEKNVSALSQSRTHKTAPSRGAVSGPPDLLGKAGLPARVGWFGRAPGAPNLSPPTAVLFPGQKVAASGEQCCTGVGEVDISAARANPWRSRNRGRPCTQPAG